VWGQQAAFVFAASCNSQHVGWCFFAEGLQGRGNAGAWPSRVLHVAWQAGVLHYLQRVLCLKLTLLSLAFLLVLLFLADPCRAQQQAERCTEPLVSVSSQILV